MFNKETHTHTHMSDKAAKLLAKTNEKIAKQQLEAQEREARNQRRADEEVARLNSSAYQERLAQQERLKAEKEIALMSNPEVYRMHIEAKEREAEWEREKERKEQELNEQMLQWVLKMYPYILAFFAIFFLLGVLGFFG